MLKRALRCRRRDRGDAGQVGIRIGLPRLWRKDRCCKSGPSMRELRQSYYGSQYRFGDAPDENHFTKSRADEMGVE